jgi:hypothetical protein
MFSSVAPADGSLGAAAARVSGTLSRTYVPSGSNLVAWDSELNILKHGAASAPGPGDPRRSAFSYNPRPDSDEE